MKTSAYFSFPGTPSPAERSDRRAFLDTIRDVLAARKPPQVDPGQTLTAEEREQAFYAIVPHRNLGGVCLIMGLWTTGQTPDYIDVSWGQVSTLCHHDDLDDSYSVASIALADHPSWKEELEKRCEEELHRPVDVYIRSPSRSRSPYLLSYSFSTSLGETEIGCSRLRRRQPAELFRRTTVDRYVTTLSSADVPFPRVGPRVECWLR